MDAETLRREGQKILFTEDLRTYWRNVNETVGETLSSEDLGDPQTVLECLDTLKQALNEIFATWYKTMMDELLDDNHPDPEPSKDSGNVGLDTLTQSQFDEWLDWVFLHLKELFVCQKLS